MPLNSAIAYSTIGVDVVAGRGHRQPARGLGDILGDAAALLVERPDRVLRLRTSGLGGGAEQLGGAREILREHLAFEIQQTEVVVGGDLPELGGRGEQLALPRRG